MAWYSSRGLTCVESLQECQELFQSCCLSSHRYNLAATLELFICCTLATCRHVDPKKKYVTSKEENIFLHYLITTEKHFVFFSRLWTTIWRDSSVTFLLWISFSPRMHGILNAMWSMKGVLYLHHQCLLWMQPWAVNSKQGTLSFPYKQVMGALSHPCKWLFINVYHHQTTFYNPRPSHHCTTVCSIVSWGRPFASVSLNARGGKQ